MIGLTPNEHTDIGFMCACYLDDYEKRIKKEEKRGINMRSARENHARQTRLVYTKVIPDSLSGDLQLMDGTILKKVQNANSTD